jgi:methionyl aminopeptidase
MASKNPDHPKKLKHRIPGSRPRAAPAHPPTTASGYRAPPNRSGHILTAVTDIETIEATGEQFSLDSFMSVRARTRRAVHSIADRVGPGMAEEDAEEIARNTTKDFKAPSEPGVILGEDDIFFIDIGPLYESYEGDAGDTFVLGDDTDHRRGQADVRAIWDDVRQVWFDQHVTGEELYQYAAKTTADRGWKLNLALSGHRLSDFPHSAHFGGALADLPFRPGPNLWVLEIAIVHPSGTFGAFYEDLLLPDQGFPEGTLP